MALAATPTAPSPAHGSREPHPRLPARTGGRRDRRAWAVHAFGLLVFVGAGYLGRWTVMDEGGLALLWPAGGVAAAWLFFSPRRERPVLLGIVGASVLVVNATAGATWGQSLAFTVPNVVQVLVFLLVVDRTCPHLWGVGGDRPLAEMRSLSNVTAAAALGAALGVGAGAAAMTLTPGGPSSELVMVWAGRNFAGLLSVFAVVHLVAYRWTQQARFTAVPGWEWVAATAFTVAVYVPVFAQDSLPLAFVPALAVLWFGLRSDAVVAAWHVLLGGAVATAYTLAGRGPFQLVGDVYDRALVVQLFLTGVLVSGLYLSAAREERAHAARDVAVERARAEQQAELLQTAVAHVSDGLVVVGADGSILDANPAARRFLELLSEQATTRVGETALRRLDGAPVPIGEMPAVRALRGETVLGEELVAVDLDGTRRILSANATPVRGNGPARVVATFRDVTEERAQVDELSAFAGVVAHDLRGPLTALQGWADRALQLGEAVPDAQPDLLLALTRIRSSSGRLADLLEGLLVHATSRDRELVREPVDVRTLLEEIAAVRDIEALLEVHEVPRVLGDATMLRHLLDNLVGNAVKFVADGITPRVVVSGRREAGQVVLTVTDNGIGVPESMRRSVFQRFERVAGTGRQGTGLGLSICRTIVERHGGEIHVGPGPGGVGSTFTVHLPAA